MIIRADARALPLRDACVQTCVTSPPYFGLRNYGTAIWVGGDPACDHFKLAGGTGAQNLGKSATASAANVERASVPFKDRCGKCGAERIDAQIGLEGTPDAYVASLVQVFREVRRVLKDNGCIFVNLGDSYSAKPCSDGSDFKDGRANRGSRHSGGLVVGMKPKDLVGIPWMVAFALRADGWYLRSDIIWSKPNPMPESVTDRPTKAHEYLFLLSKSEQYFYDAEAIAETLSAASIQRYTNAVVNKETYDPTRHKSPPPGSLHRHMGRSPMEVLTEGAARVIERGTRNKRSVWTIPTMPYAGAHFATMPEQLVEPCILAGCPLGGLVLDPFLGSGTVGAVAERLGRRWIGTDLSYQPLSKARTQQRGLRFEPEEVA
jgi:DNA modification methylase